MPSKQPETVIVDGATLTLEPGIASSGYKGVTAANGAFFVQFRDGGTVKRWSHRYRTAKDAAIAYAKANADGDGAVLELAMDRLAVELGLEIVKLVPGYVSTEVDIRASFDTAESLRRAPRRLAVYVSKYVSQASRCEFTGSSCPAPRVSFDGRARAAPRATQPGV